MSNVYQRNLTKGDHTYSGRYTHPVTHQRKLINLGTHVKKDAEKRLRDIVAAAHDERFEVLEAIKLRPNTPTIAAWLAAFDTYSAGRLGAATRKGYKNCLKYILRIALDLPGEQCPASRSIAELTRELAVTFQNKLLAAAGEDHIARDRAKTNANSFLRQAKALFAQDLRRATALQLPRTIEDFLSTPPLDEPTESYRPPPTELIQKTIDTCTALRATDRNAYLAYLLAYGAGMRRNEIAHARYSWLSKTDPQPSTLNPQPVRYYIHIGTTADFRPKGRDARIVPIDAYLWNELQALRPIELPGAESDPCGSTILAGGNNERTEETFERLAAAMRGIGWTTPKCAHELRKLYGSMIATEHGLFAAQKILGHKKPDVTSRYYAGLVQLPDIRIFKAA